MNMTRRRVPALVATTALAGGLAVSMSAAALADTATPAAKPSPCAKAHGKYRGHLITSYKITGGNDSVHGIAGGTLQLWGSDKCQTAWVKTVKLTKYTKRAYYTVAGVSTYDTKHHRWNAEKKGAVTTRKSVESPAEPTSNRSGRIKVEAGFVGPYQFDSAHTFRY
jgi:putative salt-induced outer membrane protein YdiY